MEIWKAVVVGIVQGLSEFLPISSSGHIALTQELLAMNEENAAPDITFELVLHIGTFLSVVIYFRRRLWDLFLSLFQKHRADERRMIWWLIVATIPATVAYLLFKDFFEGAYDNPVLVGCFLLVTGAVLLLPKWFRAKEREFGLPQALWMGIAQAFAVLPGISRSGSTITAGLIAGAKPALAAEFSFLMFLPAIGGGMLLKADELAKVARSDAVMAYGAGFVAAFLSGLAAVYLVLSAIKRGRLEYFAYYCFAAGLAAIVYFSTRS